MPYDIDSTPTVSDAAPGPAPSSRGAGPRSRLKIGPLRLVRAILLALTLTMQARAADSDWHSLTGSYATFQAPADMIRDVDDSPAGGGREIFQCPGFSVSFEAGNGALPRELQTDLAKAVASWSAARRENWKVNTYLEDEQHLAYAAIRTAADPTFPRPFHLSFGLAAGDKPFSIHIRFLRPESLEAVEHLLQSLKLKTL